MATITVIPQFDSMMEGISAPDTNYGSTPFTGARAVYAGENKTFLYHAIGNFVVGAVAGDTINSASLWLYITGDPDGTPLCNIERCTRPRDWIEDEVTWNDYSTGNAWTGAGGDVDATTPAAVQFNLAASTGWQEVTGLKGHVDDAIASRFSDVSLILSLEDEDPGANAGHLWRTKDYLSLVWYLAIDYTPASPAGIPFERPSRAVRALLRR